MRRITSTNGDGGLMQATLEAVDGSRFGRFFVKVVPRRYQDQTYGTRLSRLGPGWLVIKIM